MLTALLGPFSLTVGLIYAVVAFAKGWVVRGKEYDEVKEENRDLRRRLDAKDQEVLTWRTLATENLRAAERGAATAAAAAKAVGIPT